MNDLPLEELVTNITHFFPDCSYWIFDMLNDPLLLLDEFGIILFMNDSGCFRIGFAFILSESALKQCFFQVYTH